MRSRPIFALLEALLVARAVLVCWLGWRIKPVCRHGLVRVVDAADNIQVNGVFREIECNETFEAVFGSLKVEGRPLQAVRLLQLANAVRVPSPSKCSSSTKHAYI
jgi:hypothetical protein